MLAVHAFWSRRLGPCLWAEDAERPVKSGSQALRSARRHTFAAAAQRLAESHPGTAGEATLLLPSLRMAPLDSPELVRVSPRPFTRSEPMLLPWSVPVVGLALADALTMATFDEPAEAEPVRYGASVRYLGELAAFAANLVDRGRVLPTLDSHERGPRSRWRPVLLGPDIVALHALVVAMPPVFRAESDWPAEAGGQDPGELVTAALEVLVDAAARSRLATVELPPRRRGPRPRRIPAAQAWLTSLTTADGLFDGEPDEIDALQRALKEWADFGVGQTGPARATFRLVEASAATHVPVHACDDNAYDVIDDDENVDDGTDYDSTDYDGNGYDGNDDRGVQAGWRLEFLLQSTVDPSLLVPAEQVWTVGSGLSRWLNHPEELLLTELGRASRIYPALTGALRQPTPCALDLDADGAHEFLSGAAALLDEAGFGVLLPSWWDRRRRLGLALSASGTPNEGIVTRDSKFGRDQLVRFSWQLALGAETLTEEEIETLAATKAPLVRLRGQWVTIDPEQLRRGLEFLTSAPAGQRTAGEVLSLAACHPADLDLPLPLTSVRADGWLGDLLAGTAERSLRPIDPPATLRAELRPYQQRGLSWLAFLSSLGLGACLADDMGLGKTVQLLALETWQRAEDPGTGPTLLICPVSLVGNW